jgi:ribosomal protein S1
MANIVKQNTNILAEFAKIQPGFLSVLKPGDLVEGKVIEKNSKRLVVDLGKHGTGVVYRGEIQNAKEAVKKIVVGEIIHGKVVDPDNEEGFVELSISEAGKQKAWNLVQELQAKDEPFKVKILGFNKGGLITEVAGLPAFLPTSQLSGEHYPKVVDDDKSKINKALEKLVGLEIAVKLLDLNPRTNKIIVSERAASEVNIKELAKNYKVGQIIEGTISGIADFGAFVRFSDNPQVEGLIHVSEIDWKIIDNPKEVVKVDEVVKAKITEIKDGKILLSLKALKPDPWATLDGKYKEGGEVRGKVSSFNPFGALVDLGGGIQGQIHVTSFGSIEEMKKALSLGAEYQFIIDSVKPAERRIILKLKK